MGWKDLKLNVLKSYIGSYLVEKGEITEEQLQEALTYQNNAQGKRKYLGQVLVELGYTTEEKVSMDIAERRIPQDGRTTLKIDGKTIDFRVASLPSAYGEKLTLRILDRSTELITLEGLGFPNHQLKRFNNIMKLPYGFILVTGPTGSGKSTTLYSVLKELNSVTKHIITVEDPIERRIDGINQVQVNNQAGMGPMVLLGVVNSGKGECLAIIKAGNTTFVAKEGEQIVDYWTLNEVKRDYAVLISEERQTTLKLSGTSMYADQGTANLNGATATIYGSIVATEINLGNSNVHFTQVNDYGIFNETANAYKIIQWGD